MDISKQIFSVTSLRLDKISWVGFDMDYTLVEYKKPAFESMSYDLFKEYIVKELQYPEALLELQYDPGFPVRGIVLDCHLGNVLLLNSHGFVVNGYHGKTRMTSEMVHAAYPHKKINKDCLGSSRFRVVNTQFEFPVACIFRDLVEFYVASGEDVNFRLLWEDMLQSFMACHKRLLKETVLKDCSKYVKDSPIRETLVALQDAGKKIFLITNSEWFYVEGLMEYVLPEEDGKSWRDYFDIIVVYAQKPHFFADGSPFREVDINTGKHLISNVNILEKGKVYQGGNLDLFHRMLDTDPSEVLYVGDHVYGDVRYSREVLPWKSFSVFPELVDEANTFDALQNKYDDIHKLYDEKADALREGRDISDIKDQIAQLKEEISNGHHKYFGSPLRTVKYNTLFGHQISKYANIYAAHAHNLMYHVKEKTLFTHNRNYVFKLR